MYRLTHRRCRVEKLAHSASFYSMKKIAPSNLGIKQLASKMRLSQKLPLAIGLVAFLGPNVSWIKPVFNEETRWLAAIILLIYVLSQYRWYISAFLGSTIGRLSLLFVLWCGFTVVWSEFATLSLYKSLSYFVVIIAFASSAFMWGMRMEFGGILDFLLPFAILSSLAAIAGNMNYAESDSQYWMTQTGAGNANTLGIIMTLSSGYFIWKYLARERKDTIRLLYLGGSIFCTTWIFWSLSRASILGWLSIVGGVTISRGAGRVIIGGVVALFVAVTLALAFPSTLENLERTYIYKWTNEQDQGASVLKSRQDVWTISYDQAMKGGLLGGGLGVTIGATPPAEVGLSISSKYGREKDNSQLAIIEETGFIGLGLYIALLLSMASSLRRAWLCAVTSKERLVIGVLGGMLWGLVANSVFEDWFIAPGGVLPPIFWALVGILAAVTRRLSLRRRKAAPLMRFPRNSLNKRRHVFDNQRGHCLGAQRTANPK